MRMKKIINLCLSSVLLFMSLQLTVLGAEPSTIDNMVESNLVISDDISINVNIPEQYKSIMSKQDIIDLALRNAVKDGETITFYEVGEAETPIEIAPYIGESYITTVTPNGSEWNAQNYFVISVAKGQTTTLTSKFIKSLSMTISGSAYSVTADLKRMVTAEHSTSQQFVGPPETSSYNSREFRVQFYGKNMSWTQAKYDIFGKYVSTVSGTGTMPTRWASYSIDRSL